ncbi:MAG: hypothetical protein A2293_04545 [Elusimicrobia bacterium RIFOXYB2_FULL_49_7]|nr:MAG: hypothetical protein A2293_04545 [Elusimicrobia bacterium RIFOXYB2_FULL_49_7]
MIDQAQGLRTLVAQTVLRPRVAEVMDEVGLSPFSTGCTTIAVTSGKGGVGKTNISINLALALARMNKKVVLFDADLGLANVNILLGINPRWTLLDVVEGRAVLGEILIQGPGNLSIVPAGSGVERMANLDSIALMKLLRSLTVLEESCDYLIFDTSAGISNMVKAFVNTADMPLVVATPEPSSMADAYAAVKMIYNSGKAEVNLISNMVKDEEEGFAVFNKLSLLTRRFLNRTPKYLGALPSDRHLIAGVRSQNPVLLSQANAPFSRSVTRLAHRLLGHTPERDSTFFHRLFDLFR